MGSSTRNRRGEAAMISGQQHYFSTVDLVTHPQSKDGISHMPESSSLINSYTDPLPRKNTMKTMSARSTLALSKTGCPQSIAARQHQRVGCTNCLNDVRLKKQFPVVNPMSSKLSASHVEATVLRTILERHAKNPHARFQALGAVKRFPKHVKPRSTSKALPSGLSRRTSTTTHQQYGSIQQTAQHRRCITTPGARLIDQHQEE